MNKSILIGRISSDLQLRYTPKGNAVCEFNIAINRVGVEGTDFLTCVVWNKQAENLVNYQSKGSLIAVEGSNRVDKYQNDKGENRYKNYILVSNIQFLESKKEQSNNSQISNVTNDIKKEEVDPYEQFGSKLTGEDIDNIPDSDLPF